MSQYLSDNDDDLFDYDPAQELADEITVDIDQQGSVTGAGQASYEKKFIEDIKSNLQPDLDADLNGETGKINSGISNLYGSFQEAIHGFVHSVNKDYLSKSIHVTLDQLTEGRFSMVNMFYWYEMKVARKTALVQLFSHILEHDQEDGKIDPLLQELSNVLKLNLTQLFYSASFASSAQILSHSLTLDRIIYRFLSTKTGIEVNQLLFVDPENADFDIVQTIQNIESSGFRNQINNQMFSAFFAAEANEDRSTLQQMLQDAFGSSVNYIDAYKTM